MYRLSGRWIRPKYKMFFGCLGITFVMLIIISLFLKYKILSTYLDQKWSEVNLTSCAFQWKKLSENASLAHFCGRHHHMVKQNGIKHKLFFYYLTPEISEKGTIFESSIFYRYIKYEGSYKTHYLSWHLSLCTLS